MSSPSSWIEWITKKEEKNVNSKFKNEDVVWMYSALCHLSEIISNRDGQLILSRNIWETVTDVDSHRYLPLSPHCCHHGPDKDSKRDRCGLWAMKCPHQLYKMNFKHRGQRKILRLFRISTPFPKIFYNIYVVNIILDILMSLLKLCDIWIIKLIK